MSCLIQNLSPLNWIFNLSSLNGEFQCKRDFIRSQPIRSWLIWNPFRSFVCKEELMRNPRFTICKECILVCYCRKAFARQIILFIELAICNFIFTAYSIQTPVCGLCVSSNDVNLWVTFGQKQNWEECNFLKHKIELYSENEEHGSNKSTRGRKCNFTKR